MTAGDGSDRSGGPETHGRPADPFGAPHPQKQLRPDEPYREVPIGVPETPADFDERKRAAERPDPPGSGGDAQIDYGRDEG